MFYLGRTVDVLFGHYCGARQTSIDLQQLHETTQPGTQSNSSIPVYTKDTLDEKGQARDTRVHVIL